MGRKRMRSFETPVQNETAKCESSNYQPTPSLKNKAAEQAMKHGYNCVMKQGVLIFATTNIEKQKEITEWLTTNYGQPEKMKNKEVKSIIPFSYGFSNISQELEKHHQVFNHEVEEMESEEKDLE